MITQDQFDKECREMYVAIATSRVQNGNHTGVTETDEFAMGMIEKFRHNFRGHVGSPKNPHRPDTLIEQLVCKITLAIVPTAATLNTVTEGDKVIGFKISHSYDPTSELRSFADLIDHLFNAGIINTESSMLSHNYLETYIVNKSGEKVKLGLQTELLENSYVTGEDGHRFHVNLMFGEAIPM